jgi:hypothetical protein
MQRLYYGAWELRLKGVYDPDLVLPITHYPLPITHYPLPITHYQQHEQVCFIRCLTAYFLQSCSKSSTLVAR